MTPGYAEAVVNDRGWTYRLSGAVDQLHPTLAIRYSAGTPFRAADMATLGPALYRKCSRAWDKARGYTPKQARAQLETAIREHLSAHVAIVVVRD